MYGEYFLSKNITKRKDLENSKKGFWLIQKHLIRIDINRIQVIYLNASYQLKYLILNNYHTILN